MPITDYKVQEADFTGKDIAGLPAKPSEAGITAAQLQEQFDKGAKKVVAPRLNALIDTLSGTEGAANLGATQIAGVSGYTVQDILAALKGLLDTKQSIEQSDWEIAQKFDKTEAQSLVKSITFTEQDGVFLVTKYDGTVNRIDTAMEKVALDVRLEGQQFVLTLVDGTEQRVDLSAFLTQTERKDSDTIQLAEEAGVLVARLVRGSVEREYLSDAVTAYLEEKERAAAASATEAGVQAGNALASANAAATSQQAAVVCADNACRCASNAEITAQEVTALKAETVAAAAAEVAKAAAKASAAAESANEAASSASIAAQEAAKAKNEADRAEDIAGGDVMTRAVYDPTGKRQDIFAYTDHAVAEVDAAVTEVAGTVAENQSANQKALAAHLADKENPHEVGAKQVDYNGNSVWDALNSLEDNLHDLEAEELQYIKEDISTHTADTTNPHKVTREQLGAAAAAHTHETGDITSGVLDVARGGTGAGTFTAGAALIGNGTSAPTTRTITNNTASGTGIGGSTNLVTMNTLRYALNRTTGPTAADTNYGTYMMRAIAAGTSAMTANSTGLTSGCIYLQYE